MAKYLKTKKGKVFKVLRNPSEKASKYATELKHGFAVNRTGNGWSYDSYGEKIELNPEQLSYRSGYLQARADNGKAWKHNQNK